MVFQDEEEFVFSNRLYYQFRSSLLYIIPKTYNKLFYIKMEFDKDEIRKVAFYYELYFPGELLKSNIDISEIVDDDNKIYNALLTFFNPWIYGRNRLKKIYYCFNNVLTYDIYNKLYNGDYNEFKTINASTIYYILAYMFIFFPTYFNSINKLYQHLILRDFNIPTNKWKNSPIKQNNTTYENFVDFIPYYGSFQTNKLSKQERENIYSYFQEYKHYIKELYEIFNLKHKSQISIFNETIFYNIMSIYCNYYSIFMTDEYNKLINIIELFNLFNPNNSIDYMNIDSIEDKRKIFADTLCKESDNLKIALEYYTNIIDDYYKLDKLNDLINVKRIILLYNKLFPDSETSIEDIDFFKNQSSKLQELKDKINEIKQIKLDENLFNKFKKILKIKNKEKKKEDGKGKNRDGKGKGHKDGKAKGHNDGKGKAKGHNDGKGKGQKDRKAKGHNNEKKGGALDDNYEFKEDKDDNDDDMELIPIDTSAIDNLDINVIKFIFNSCLLLYQSKINNLQTFKVINSLNDISIIRSVFLQFCKENLEHIINLYNICSNQNISFYYDKIFTKEIYNNFCILSSPYGKKWWKIKKDDYKILINILEILKLYIKYNNIDTGTNIKDIDKNYPIEEIYKTLCYNKIYLFNFLKDVRQHTSWFDYERFRIDDNTAVADENRIIIFYFNISNAIQSIKIHYNNMLLDDFFHKYVRKLDNTMHGKKIIENERTKYLISHKEAINFLNYLNDLKQNSTFYNVYINHFFFNIPNDIDIEISLKVYLYIAKEFIKIYPDLLDKDYKYKYSTPFKLYEFLFNFFAKHFKQFTNVFESLNILYKQRKVLDKPHIDIKEQIKLEELRKKITELLNDNSKKRIIKDNLTTLFNHINNHYIHNYNNKFHTNPLNNINCTNITIMNIFIYILDLIKRCSTIYALTMILKNLIFLSDRIQTENILKKKVYTIYFYSKSQNNNKIIHELLEFYNILNLIYYQENVDTNFTDIDTIIQPQYNTTFELLKITTNGINDQKIRSVFHDNNAVSWLNILFFEDNNNFDNYELFRKINKNFNYEKITLNKDKKK